jgi:hypothetical protein
MEQPPFPTALILMVVFFGFLALVSEPVWMRITAGIGALVIAAAAIYQSRPKRVEIEHPDDERPDVEPAG